MERCGSIARSRASASRRSGCGASVILLCAVGARHGIGDTAEAMHVTPAAGVAQRIEHCSSREEINRERLHMIAPTVELLGPGLIETRYFGEPATSIGDAPIVDPRSREMHCGQCSDWRVCSAQ